VLDLAKIAPESARPLKRAEYDRLVELGFFEDERIELLYGVLVQMTPQKPPHASRVQALTKLLLPPLLDRAEVRIQLSFAASDESQPEPDVAVVPPGDYRTEHPSRAWLIIEVADSARRKDREVKSRLYAECGVPEYWVVDIQERCVEVFRDPREGTYASSVVHSAGAVVALLQFPDVSVPVDALF
jgi:Uma2 family endonuclease